MNVLEIVGRRRPLLQDDLSCFAPELDQAVKMSRFLVIGGAGSIGQEVTTIATNLIEGSLPSASPPQLLPLFSEIKRISRLGYAEYLTLMNRTLPS